jgi:hypothetical protein
MNNLVQYRPYLYLSEIKLLISKLDDKILEEAATKKKLQLVVLKADSGLIDGSYTPSPRKTLEQRLELDLDDSDMMAQIAADLKERKT